MVDQSRRKISISMLVTAIVLIVTVFPLLLVGFTTYTTAKKNLIEQSYAFSSDLLTVRGQNLKNTLDTIHSLSDKIAGGYFITEFSQYGSTSQPTLDVNTLQRNLRTYLGIQGIKSIDVAFVNGNVLTTRLMDDPKGLYSTAKIESLLKKTAETETGCYFSDEVTTEDGNTSHKLMSAIRPVHRSGLAGSEIIGILIITFPLDLVPDDGIPDLSGVDPKYALVDSDGHLLNEDAPTYLSGEVMSSILPNFNSTNGYFTQSIHGKPYLFSYSKLDLPDAYLVSSVPLNSLERLSSMLLGNSTLVLFISILISLSVGLITISVILMPFNKIIKAVQQIKSGSPDWSLRSPASPIRELDELSNWFNAYIETEKTHQDTEKALNNSEKRYHSLFEDLPIPLWEEDFSDVIRGISELPLGNHLLEEYLVKHPDQVTRLISKLKILDVNQATLSLYKATSKQQIMENTDKIFQNVNTNQVRQELIQMSRRTKVFEMTLENSTFEAEVANIRMRWSVFPGYEENMGRVIVSTMDITQEVKDELLKSTVMQITQEASSAATLQELYHSIHWTLSKIMPAENLYIALYDDESGMISFPYFVDQYDEPPEPHSFGNGWTEYVIRTGKPSLLSRDQVVKLQEEEGISNSGADSIDWLGVPLIVKDRTIGVLAVQTYEAGTRYNQEHCDWLTIVSTQIAMAIDRKKAEEALKFSSTHDKLTGLYNRAYFEEEVTRLAAGRQNPVGVIMMDVDGLKETNDTCGHAEGDEVLRSTSRILQQAFRTNDLVARIGGDEFVVLLPYSTGTVVNKAIVRIGKYMEKNNHTSNCAKVSLSTGMACTEDGISLTDAIKLADQRMYEEKYQRRLTKTIP